MGKAGGEFADLALDIGKLAAADLTQVIRAVKRKLKMLQYRLEAILGWLADTDLILDV
ncbi:MULTISPECIES: hypothetical protein [unclassified Streptomyces]|uniref:hypothetical protein n=1 Tax=unclassified Streptomyces TaxID=2593676 RepID=UPI003246FB25